MVGQKVNLFPCKGNSGMEISEFFHVISGAFASLIPPDPLHVSGDIHFSYSPELLMLLFFWGGGGPGGAWRPRNRFVFRQREFRGESETARIQN